MKFYRGIGAALVLLAGSGAHADLIDLGTLGGATSQAWAIQSNGRVVVGVSDNGSGQQAFVYQVNAGFTGGTITALDFLTGGSAAEARAINASGLIVGYSSDSGAIDQAVSWTGTSPTLITNTLLGSGARALGVSTGGTVVGWANDEVPGVGVVQRAFVSVGGVMSALDLTGLNPQHDPNAGLNARALGISPDGRYVVGEYEIDNGAGGFDVHGFVYDRTSPLSSYELSAGGVGSARASNNGFAVGSIFNGGDLVAGFSTHATNSSNYLPTLGSSGRGNAINASGVVVGGEDLGAGIEAVLWDAAALGATVTNLNSLHSTGNILNEATGVADISGVYTGWGTFGGQTHGFLLTPNAPSSAPEPATLAFLVLGGTLVIIRRRR
ncbi:PEP-CTERM sorting domain-containing protein [Armatimonas sp.]|uniref:PEP-CTERM sorting domain-containing protein n=1 Tax=Armatimonas sp. TaxID=1872638 RepID=UPI00374C93EA